MCLHRAEQKIPLLLCVSREDVKELLCVCVCAVLTELRKALSLPKRDRHQLGWSGRSPETLVL